MTDDHRDRMPETPLLHDGDPLRGPSASILDALDMAGVGEFEIKFERPPSQPRPATFDRSIDRPDGGGARIIRADMVYWPAVTPAQGSAGCQKRCRGHQIDQ